MLLLLHPSPPPSPASSFWRQPLHLSCVTLLMWFKGSDFYLFLYLFSHNERVKASAAAEINKVLWCEITLRWARLHQRCRALWTRGAASERAPPPIIIAVFIIIIITSSSFCECSYRSFWKTPVSMPDIWMLSFACEGIEILGLPQKLFSFFRLKNTFPPSSPRCF